MRRVLPCNKKIFPQLREKNSLKLDIEMERYSLN